MSKTFLHIASGSSYPGLAADPSDPNNGDFYYNTTSNVFRQYTGGAWSNVGSGSGTVTSISVASSNGLAGSSSGGATPTLTLSTTATGFLQGNGTAITGLTATQVTADLNLFTSSLQGLVPGSGGGTTNFLRADGTWATPASGSGTVTSVTFTGDGTVLSSTPSSAVTTSGTLTATLNTQTANTFLAGPTSGSAADPTFRAQTSSDTTLQTMDANRTFNLGLSASVASNALTIALTQNDGSTNATAANPVVIGFRNITSTTGSYSRQAITSSLSITVPSGASLGQTSGMNQYVWVYALLNSGVVQLGVSGVELFSDYSVQSSTTISSGSTSGTTLYSTTGVGSVPIRLIGRVLVDEATAGTWASAPNEVALVSGPQPVTVTDFASYTPSFSGFTSTSGVSFFYKRVGDSIQILGSFSSTATSSTAYFTLPAGININQSSTMKIGSYGRTSANSEQHALITQSGNNNNIYFSIQTGSFADLNTEPGSNLIGTEYVAVFTTLIPISGWSNYGP